MKRIIKKTISIIFLILIIIAAVGSYFLLANNKMLIKVTKKDVEGINSCLTTSLNLVNGYGNFNFSYTNSYENLNTSVNADIKVKYDGDKRYMSAKSTYVNELGKTIKEEYYLEDINGTPTLYLKRNNGEIETKEKITNYAWDYVFTTLLKRDYSRSVIYKYLEKDTTYTNEEFNNIYQDSSFNISFKPFYFGATLSVENVLQCRTIYEISLKGNIRKITQSDNNPKFSESIILNKAGKPVTIDSLSDQAKSEYISIV